MREADDWWMMRKGGQEADDESEKMMRRAEDRLYALMYSDGRQKDIPFPVLHSCPCFFFFVALLFQHWLTHSFWKSS